MGDLRNSPVFPLERLSVPELTRLAARICEYDLAGEHRPELRRTLENMADGIEIYTAEPTSVPRGVLIFTTRNGRIVRVR